jgi:probable HAF family extracellular repeat protein
MWDSINGRRNPFGSGDISTYEINDMGQVVGTARNANGYLQAFIWDDTNGLRFLNLPAGYQGSVGLDINNSGHIAFDAIPITEPHPHHSFIWYDFVLMEELGSLGGIHRWVFGMNNQDQIVGDATVPNGGRFGRGYIWDKINGMQNINDLILLKEGFEYISAGVGINDSGQIIAQGIVDEENGIYHAFLLTPLVTVKVGIDIKPGSDPNCLNVNGHGVIPVAINGTEDFDVNEVNLSSLNFAGLDVRVKGNGEPQCGYEDWNEDGSTDLVCHFVDDSDKWAPENDTATLTGMLTDGTYIQGEDSIGCKVSNYSGTYCLNIDDSNLLDIIINQSGKNVNFTLMEETSTVTTGTGSLTGKTMTLEADLPDGPVILIIEFSNDGQSLSGTYEITGSPSESGSLTGTKGKCTDYEYPEGDPACILPIKTDDLALVTGGQQYTGTDHIGIDFRLETDGVEIIAPCGGVVTEINKSPNPKNTYAMFSVTIRYNADWNMLIVFEPDTPVQADVDRQESEIDVNLGDIVAQGDVLGRLVVSDPGVPDWYPHTHWTIFRNDVETEHVCPADYLTTEAETALMSLYGSFGLLPVCNY